MFLAGTFGAVGAVIEAPMYRRFACHLHTLQIVGAILLMVHSWAHAGTGKAPGSAAHTPLGKSEDRCLTCLENGKLPRLRKLWNRFKVTRPIKSLKADKFRES